MKTLLTILALTFSTTSAFAATSKSDLKLLKALADKTIQGTDVRKTVKVFNNTEENPCADEGVSYIVKVEIKKSQIKMNPNGEPSQSREWQEVNQYYISQKDLRNGGQLNDSLCME